MTAIKKKMRVTVTASFAMVEMMDDFRGYELLGVVYKLERVEFSSGRFGNDEWAAGR